MDDSPIAKLHQSLHSVPSFTTSYKSVASDELELTDYNTSRQSKPPFYQTRFWNQRQYQYLRHGRFWKRILLDLWRRTLLDVRNAPWIWMFRRFISHVLPLIVIVGLISLLVIMSLPDFIMTSDSDVCQPDGTFSLSYAGYSPWKRDSIFAINMGYGNYSFGVAKLIDVVWDVVVGRGGQVLLAIFSYKTFTKALTYRMETQAVSHETFRAVTLENDTLPGLLRLVKNFSTNMGVLSKAAMFWTILATLFILSVPTWLSAMTGYSAVIVSFVLNSNDNFIPAVDFQPTIYIIHDGERLGPPYMNDYHVNTPWTSGMYLGTGVYDCPYAYGFNYTTDEYTWRDLSNENCTLLWRLSEYASIYGLLGRNDTESQFVLPNQTVVNLTAPSLNFSARFAQPPDFNPIIDGSFIDEYWYYLPYGRAWKDPVTNDYPFQANDPLFYDESTKTAYNLTEFNANGSCLQEKIVNYKWGFSFLLLYVFILTLLLWSVGMYAFYLNAYFHSRLDRIQRDMGTERAVIDLYVEMQKKLEAEKVEMYSSSKLEKLVKGNTITYVDLPLDTLPPPRLTQMKQWWKNFEFVPWMKAEKWWLLALSLFTMFFIMSLTIGSMMIHWSVFGSWLPVLGVLLVLTVGRAVESRWLIFAFLFLIFIVVDIWRVTTYNADY